MRSIHTGSGLAMPKSTTLFVAIDNSDDLALQNFGLGDDADKETDGKYDDFHAWILPRC